MDTMPTGPAPTGPPGATPAGPALPGAVPPGAAPATVVPVNTDDPAYWRAKAAAARAKARTLPWESDPELRAQVDMILSMDPSERIRQLQAQIDLFASAVLVEE